MTFPSADGSRAQNLDLVWDQIRAIVSEIKSFTTVYRAKVAAGTTADVLLNHLTFLADRRAQLASLVATPGIAAYAQEAIQEPTLNIATEYTAMSNAITALGTWIVNNFPKDANGYLLAATLVGGVLTYRSFSAATLAPLLTLTDALLATID